MKFLLKPIALFRTISLAVIFSLIMIVFSPNSFDTVFLLFIECVVMYVLLFVLSFFAADFLDGIMKVLVSAFVTPIMLFLLGCGLLLCVLIFTGGGPEEAAKLPYPLLHHCWLIMDDPILALKQILNYFGNDFYWITGSFLVYHLVFDFLSVKLGKPKKQEDDLWFRLQKQVMLQTLAIFLGVLMLTIPISIAIFTVENQAALTYGLVIGLRLLIEVWKNYLDRDTDVSSQ